MADVTVGDIRIELDHIKVAFNGLARLLRTVRPDVAWSPGPIECPPLPLPNPSGKGCDLPILGFNDLPVTVADVNESVVAMRDWVGEILAFVEGLDQSLKLPPKGGDLR